MTVTIYQRNYCDGVLEIDEVIKNVKSIKEIGNNKMSVLSIDFVNANNITMNRCITMDGFIEVSIA